MKQTFLWSAMFVVYAAILYGCASAAARDRVDKLEQTLSSYSSALRWGDYRGALSLHISQDDENPPAEPDMTYLEQFKVTDFNIVKKDITSATDEDGVTQATVLAEINYIHVDRQVVKKLQIEQIWRYQPERKRWVVTTDFPAFK